jgi:hypothetical protein
MERENTILSLNPDGPSLHRQESALRESGFEIISVSTPLTARFEIEMGRCGVFLASYITPLAIYRNLADLFRNYCPQGLVIYMTQQSDDHSSGADVLLSDQDQPEGIAEGIRAIQRLRQVAK